MCQYAKTHTHLHTCKRCSIRDNWLIAGIGEITPGKVITILYTVYNIDSGLKAHSEWNYPHAFLCRQWLGGWVSTTGYNYPLTNIQSLLCELKSMQILWRNPVAFMQPGHPCHFSFDIFPVIAFSASWFYTISPFPWRAGGGLGCLSPSLVHGEKAKEDNWPFINIYPGSPQGVPRLWPRLFLLFEYSADPSSRRVRLCLFSACSLIALV